MKPEIFVLLNNIRSLHNVGSIFRTSDGAGVAKIFLCGQTGYPPRPEITKTALGAEEVVEWEYWIDAKECIKKLCHPAFGPEGSGPERERAKASRRMNKKSVQLVALEQTKKSIDYRKFKPKGPVCLVLGHEIEGVADPILKLCDEVIEIPMQGKKQSLNVSVAFGVVAYYLTNNKR